MNKYFQVSVIILVTTLLGSVTAYAQGTQLLREPSISESEIVFVYANDLWKTDRDGGNAIRLTSNIGGESNPHFLPMDR